MDKLRFAQIGCGHIARKHAHVRHGRWQDGEIAAFVYAELTAEQATHVAGSITNAMR